MVSSLFVSRYAGIALLMQEVRKDALEMRGMQQILIHMKLGAELKI